MIFKKIQFIFLLVVFMAFPHSAQAAITYISSDAETAHQDDTVSVEVRLNTEGEAINVVEGDILIDGAKNIEIREISISGSRISFWSRKPSLSEDHKVISFVGGVPGGINEKDALLFKVFFTGKQQGKISFTPLNILSYKNDGKGTLASQTLKSLAYTISSSTGNGVNRDEWTRIISSDNLPPEFLAANVGQDPSMFENKLYLMINGTDYQSGIDHYEIKEGNSNFVRTGNIYVLQDQTQSSVVTINAYDKAGNIRTLVIKPAFTKQYAKVIFIGTFVLFIVALGAGIVFLSKKKKKS